MTLSAKRLLEQLVPALLVLIAVPLTAAAQHEGCDTQYPPPGLDSFESTAQIIFTPVGGPPLTIDLEGPVEVQRGPEQNDGQFFIETEIVSMELTGFHPDVGVVIMRTQNAASQCPGQPAPSLGQVRGTATTRFPATSFFDVFVELELVDMGLTACNHDQPFHVVNDVVNCLPPQSPYFSGPIDVPIFGPGGVVIGTVNHAEHNPSTGACCDPTTGVCVDGLLAVQCPPPLEYHPDECCCKVPCGPVPVEPATWGEIKSTYDNPESDDQEEPPNE